MGVAITVVGSVNLDFVATAKTLPAPGETVTGATLARHPGGKGANQALAAARLGAQVAMVARVGQDSLADEALSLLKAEGVNLSRCLIDAKASTGVALIAVDADDLIIGATRQARLALGLTAASFDRPAPMTDVFGSEANRGEALAEAERSALQRALARTDGNVSAAAEALGISRATLHRKLKRLDVKKAH